MLEQALEYLQRGFSVIPIASGSKKPPSGFKWKQYQSTLPTKEDVTQWFTQYPGANIAVITGEVSQVVVVDIDDKTLLQETLYTDPTELIVKTARGYHLYYSYPEGGVANQVRVNQRLVDVRGNGGYVIAPPSIHATGEVYQFFSSGDMGSPPLWLTAKKELEETPEHWLTEILRGVAQGERAAQGVRLAGYYFSKGIPVDVCESLLANWNSHNQPPMDHAQVTSIAFGTYQTATNRQIPLIRVLPPLAVSPKPLTRFEGVINIPKSDRGYVVDNWQKGVETEAQELQFLGLHEFARVYGGVSEDWLIEGWVPSESIILMVAPPESFKTWLGLDMLISISGGYPFLERKTKQGPVLMLQLEDKHGETINRLDLIHHQKVYGDSPKVSSDGTTVSIRTLPPLPFGAHPHRALSLLDMSSLRGLEDAIRELRPALVYIDPLYAAGSTQDYLASTAEHFGVLKLLRDAYHVTFVIAHHTKKVADKDLRKEANRELGWGSQFINAATEGTIHIRQIPDEPTKITVYRQSKAEARPEPLVLDFDINTKQAPYYYHVTEGVPAKGKTAKSGSQLEKIRQVLQVDSQLTVAEISTETGLGVSTVRRYIKELKEANEVSENKKRYSLTTGALII